jgi:thermolabile hemolysin
MANYLFSMSLLSVVFSIISCGPEFLAEPKPAISPEQGQDALVTIFKDDQFPIACFYFDPASPDYGQGFLKKTAWLWATVPQYDYVAAKGKMQDGYLLTDRIEALDWHHPTKTVATTLDGLEKVCQGSIDAKYPNKGLKLYKFHAYKTRLPGATKYPIVIAPEEKLKPNALTRLLIFGDSLSDVGRTLSTLKVMPSPPYFLGRFSNGPIWSDIIQISANLAVQNRAKGGAVSDPNIDFGVSQIVSMVRDRGRALVTGSTLKTIRDFLEQKTTGNKLENPEKTLIMLWVGANDYVAKFDTKDDMTNLVDNPETIKKGGRWVARFSVRNILDQLRVLYIAGGRNFLVGNMPNMGITPGVVESKNYVSRNMSERERKYHLSTTMTKVSQYHNELLKEGLDKLRGEYPDAQFILFDAYRALQNIITGTGPDGEANFDWGIDRERSFTDLTVPGKPTIKVGRMCYTGSYLGSNDDSEICKDSRSILFWDQVHPTAKGHCSIAFMIHKQLYEDGFIATKPQFQDYLEMCRVNYAR